MHRVPAMRVRFSPYVLDLESRQLLRGDDVVHLSPKAFDLLSILVSDRPKALSKSDLQERLWPGTFVVEKNLANLVSEIRDAIGDDPANPRFIRTVHRFGYAFRETVLARRGGPRRESRRRRVLPAEMDGRPRHARGGRACDRPRPRRGDLPELRRGLAASCADRDFGGPGDD